MHVIISVVAQVYIYMRLFWIPSSKSSFLLLPFIFLSCCCNFRDIVRHIGLFASNAIREGPGKTSYSNHHTLEGTFSNDLADGEGVFRWKDGSVYKGHFKEGKKEGEGEWSDGNSKAKYIGHWSNNKKHGFGVATSKRGDFYEGEMKDGLKDGTGKMCYANGNVYEGMWAKGKRDGTADGVHLPRCS